MRGVHSELRTSCDVPHPSALEPHTSRRARCRCSFPAAPCVPKVLQRCGCFERLAHSLHSVYWAHAYAARPGRAAFDAPQLATRAHVDRSFAFSTDPAARRLREARPGMQDTKPHRAKMSTTPPPPATALLQISRTPSRVQVWTPGLRANPFVLVPACVLACAGAAALFNTYTDDDVADALALLVPLLAAAAVVAVQVATSALAGFRASVADDAWHVVQRRRACFGFWLQQRRQSGCTSDLASAEVPSCSLCAQPAV